MGTADAQMAMRKLGDLASDEIRLAVAERYRRVAASRGERVQLSRATHGSWFGHCQSSTDLLKETCS